MLLNLYIFYVTSTIYDVHQIHTLFVSLKAILSAPMHHVEGVNS